ncbi:MAG: hypothetical protein NZL85_04390 [Fimbriimonadales bacterium]|nr:hypothetical protein [Fimbriimonadales bacterium]
MMRSGQWTTARVVALLLGLLLLIYLVNTLYGYYRLSRMQLRPIAPSHFTLLGFPSREMEERRWKIIIAQEVPKVVEVLREQRFGRPELGAEEGAVRRVEIEQVLKVCPVVLTEQQVQDVWTERREAEVLRARPEYFVVHLRLTPEGRARLWHYARTYVARPRPLGEPPADERLLLVVDKQPWAAPIIRSEVASSWWLLSRVASLQTSDVQIQPIFDEEVANEIVNGFRNAQQLARKETAP